MIPGSRARIVAFRVGAVAGKRHVQSVFQADIGPVQGSAEASGDLLKRARQAGQPGGISANLGRRHPRGQQKNRVGKTHALGDQAAIGGAPLVVRVRSDIRGRGLRLVEIMGKIDLRSRRGAGGEGGFGLARQPYQGKRDGFVAFRENFA